MKYILIALLMFGFSINSQAAETKRVCKDAVGKDNKPIKNKDGSIKKTCNDIKVHKKLDGNKVPDGKKKVEDKKTK